MVRSSVLDKLTASLCDAILERSDSASMLVEVERSNLFLLSLDEAGAYRQLVLDVAVAVAEAKGGVKPGETAALDKIREALGST